MSLGRSCVWGCGEAAEPVKASAEQLAVSTDQPYRLPWSRMRVGVTQRRGVCRAEAARRKARHDPERAPNLFDLLLLGRSLEPALAAEHREGRGELEHVLDASAALGAV
jgi:hypothetical protein